VNRPLRIAVLALLAASFALAVHVDFPLCPLASSCGIPCPGCGLTRATFALLHGDIRSALRLHPLVWLLSPLFIGFVGSAVFELVRGPSLAPPRARIRWASRRMSLVATGILLLTLSVWLARFAGYFGGPVPVTSMREWLLQRASAR
jgi:hypothetical protein